MGRTCGPRHDAFQVMVAAVQRNRLPIQQPAHDRQVLFEPARSLPQRFYKLVSVAGERPELAIHLDGKPIRTPLKRAFEVPSRDLAEAIALEWQAQENVIDPSTMPLTKLANTTIDRVNLDRSRIIEEIVGFAGSDLVCYRADEPAGLHARQAAAASEEMRWFCR